ncbi:MAG: NAD-dependent epimerase/dehydratase family protein [Clostridia bacterium]|nr:NAD-dependent epimerase/dehydratase family protein [Clostridia bacterium]
MRILITGARGFVGRNLTAALANIHDILPYDRNTDPALLAIYAGQADFIIHLAGVNRADDPQAILDGNIGITETLLDTLGEQGNTCPILFASSVQATLEGRYNTPYGQSKRACEERLFAYARQTGATVLIYRLPNLFGKWCRPGYNSVVATFCHDLTRDLPITVHHPTEELELLYIDDLIAEVQNALEGKPHRDFRSPAFCVVPVTHRATVGEIAHLLESFRDSGGTPMIAGMAEGSLEKKLYATWLSYLPSEKVSLPLVTHYDARGSFTELLRSELGGQISVNVTKPGVTKGQHWHMTKHEIFVAVAGKGLIRMRSLNSEEILEFPVSGECPEAIRILPGYVHSITNLSEDTDLVMLMWASEWYDPERPDTYSEEV